MEILDFLSGDTQKFLTLEDCVKKMFPSAGIDPNREENSFSAVVLGKPCAFFVTLSCMEGSRVRVYVRFPIPVEENVAFAVNYEVKRIAKEAVDFLPEAQVSLSKKRCRL